jgi:hypothetical protein
MKNLISVIAVMTSIAFSGNAGAADKVAGLEPALDVQDLPTFYIETAARSTSPDLTLDTLAFYTPMVAREEFGADVQIAESFFQPLIISRAAPAADLSLDLLVFYTPMVARPIATFDLATDTLAFYTPMAMRKAELDVLASIDTLSFYTQMVARPIVVEFDIQTSFDVPVPYERRAANSVPEST